MHSLSNTMTFTL